MELLVDFVKNSRNKKPSDFHEFIAWVRNGGVKRIGGVTPDPASSKRDK